MGVLNKFQRRIKDAIERWETYIADGRCSSYDEYMKSVATLRTYRELLLEVDEAVADEMNEGSPA